ncbi:helix-turn-helix domain-containing protein [Oscillospiraceae bacterium OttesenSCG-928-F05]|nr:helix-turn-helix domain-containing protein [Oscillospiraceae bacterium OttesenSCG-928-F05]
MHYENLKLMRQRNELSQEDVARVLHCQREVYRRYEKGIREIPVWALVTLAEFYETSTDYLLGRTSEKRAYPKPKL